MTQTTRERARGLAQSLVEFLTSYEEELMALEREAPAVGAMRRAVGMTIAEACYWISDEGAGASEWPSPFDGQARSAG